MLEEKENIIIAMCGNHVAAKTNKQTKQKHKINNKEPKAYMFLFLWNL